MGRLGFLDLSGTVGHAVLTRGERPRFGTLPLEGPDLSWRIGQFALWLDDWHAVEQFDALGWERPLLTPKDTVDLLELLYGLVGVCYAFVGRRKMPWREVSVTDAKIALTGKGKATKEEMLYAARRHMGWRVDTHHEADAGAGGVVAYERLWPKVRTAA